MFTGRLADGVCPCALVKRLHSGLTLTFYGYCKYDAVTEYLCSSMIQILGQVYSEQGIPLSLE